METAQVVGQMVNTPEGPFALMSAMWIAWFLIGIFFLWVDLVHKVSLGSLSIAAVITVFVSFFTPVSSQVLVFCFFAAMIYVGAHVRKEHHQKLRHYYVH